MIKVTNLLISFFKWYIEGVRQPSLNSIARLILIWSLTALAAISASVNFETDWLNVSLSSGNSSSLFFMFLVVCSLCMLAYSEYRDRQLAIDSLLFKIRHMGLIDHGIDDVENYFPKSLKRFKPQAFNMEFGNSHKTTDLEALNSQLSKIARIPEALNESGSSLNNANKHIVYSGVAPVPMIAAAGHAVSNMQNVHVADWNRQDKKWHFSTDLDDNENIKCESATLNSSEESVCLIIELSLPISVDKILSDFPETDCCKVSWADDNPRYDKLCSVDKQNRIVGEILHFINSELLPHKTGLKEIKVFVAAQASFIFRLGSALNQGHLPKITFYHYNPEHKDSNHPWGVSFVGGRNQYELTH
ncbi:SAVED domain-containing protein [Pseudoalteromonas sp. 2CM39R]|uniref:SAVED domain-containing protein n=1 Tax=Pseudoalteromonas sp. 2CM39R TaxID=2929856 RepID=UPI0020C083D7|nr:SAVED domain-containing protein [Pseudoalteromonas sp. 2CM39R]MCK8123919.1 SAVED domain-containing protein [Pseudoalteromonas sp. 2CM39R]